MLVLSLYEALQFAGPFASLSSKPDVGSLAQTHAQETAVQVGGFVKKGLAAEHVGEIGAVDTEFEEFSDGVGRARGVSSRGPPAGLCADAAASPSQLRGLDSPPTPAGDEMLEDGRGGLGGQAAKISLCESLHCVAGVSEEPAAPHALRKLLPGMVIRMVGLQARPELNGKVGVLVKHDDKTGRWQVRLRGHGDMLLKDINLEPARHRDPQANDIELIMAQAQCSREKAVAALQANSNDVVQATCALMADDVRALEPDA